MKKKTIVYFILAALFLLSTFSGISSGNATGGIGCFILCLLFAFLAYRSWKRQKENIENTASSSTPPPNIRSLQAGNSITPAAAAPKNEPTVYALDLPADCGVCEYLTLSLVGSDAVSDNGETPLYNLCRLYLRDKCFADKLALSLTTDTLAGNPAFCIRANDLPIGFIPETHSQFVLDNSARVLAITQLKVFCDSGTETTYRAEITLALKPEFELKEIKVAGVTFKNDDGKKRQTILRKINFQEVPYDDYLDITLKDYLYENELAYAVFVNGSQIGNIPKPEIPFIRDNMARISDIDISVYGGGRNEAGYAISYGACLTIKLKNL